MQGERDTAHPPGEKRVGEESFQGLCVQLAQEVCKQTGSTYCSDQGPTCHQGDQTAWGPRDTSTLKGLSTEHSLQQSKMTKEIQESWPWALTAVQPATPLMGTDLKNSSQGQSRGSNNSTPYLWQTSARSNKAELLWWRKQTLRHILLFRACFESWLEKTCCSGCEQEYNWH